MKIIKQDSNFLCVNFVSYTKYLNVFKTSIKRLAIRNLDKERERDDLNSKKVQIFELPFSQR